MAEGTPGGPQVVAGNGPGRRPTRRRWLIGLGVAALLLAVELLLLAMAPGTVGEGVTRAVLISWCCVLLLLGVRRLWRWMTYRVGVRLFFSYLLIGLTPFALCGVLAVLAGYVFVGQYGAIRVGEEVERTDGQLASVASRALSELHTHGITAAKEAIVGSRVGPTAAPLQVDWLVTDGSTVWHSGTLEELALPKWAPAGEWRGGVLIGERAYRAVLERDGGLAVAALMPLDVPNARALARDQWFDLRFIAARHGATASGSAGNLTINIDSQHGEEPAHVGVNGHPVTPEQVEPGWIASTKERGPLWRTARVIWFWKDKPLRLWEDGSDAKGWDLLTLIQVRVAAAIGDFFGSSEGLGGEVKTMFRVAATVFGIMYLVAAGFAALMIVSVARSTARLTRGAREVGRGNLAHRIRVRRRDQLGDLAVAFNTMTQSVEGMLGQVAEKERMAREMELAREIQDSLLPWRGLTHDGIVVHATFRPAAEVGGDYFDLFPLGPGRLLLTVGDVAGHGLPTGLLMAMVKSAVAALVAEGHRGRDLLTRLNSLVLQHPARHRMVTLATVEIDATAGSLEVTNTGHPPVFIIRPGGEIEEILLGALPLGGPWPTEPATRHAAFPAGSKLVIYSDGLVEAVNQEGHPFGSDALGDLLRRRGELPAEQLLAEILAELERFTAGTPFTDDLTVLVVAFEPPA